MSKETKFGYGFLLVGIGAPYLIDYFFGGRITAFVVALLCCVMGAWLLFSGHTHERLELRNWKILVAVFLTILAVGGSGWRLFHRTKLQPQQNASLSVPNTNPLQKYPDITWHSTTPFVTDVKFSKVDGMASVTLNTALIPKLYWKDFSLLLVFRPADDSVDALTDTRIEKSQAFEITGGTRTIQVNLSKEFFRRAGHASKTLSTYNVGLYVGLIPKSILPQQILTISDITALGGKQLKIEPDQQMVRNPNEGIAHKTY